MKYKVKFIADDGTTFEKETDAMKYCEEKNIEDIARKIKEKVTFYDISGEEIPFSDLNKDRDCFIIVNHDLLSPEEFAVIQKFIPEPKYSCLEGIYFWDSYFQSFRKCQKHFEDFLHRIYFEGK